MAEVDFDALENALKKKDAEEKGAILFAQARARLVLGKKPATVFFASMALKLKPEQSFQEKTAFTDGKRIVYNPTWFAGHDLKMAQGIIAHEVMHVAMKHHTRRGDRDPERWNEACDLAVNPILEEAGLTLPGGALMPGKGKYAKLPVGLSAEEYYHRLQEKKPKKRGDGDGSGGGEGAGGEGDQGQQPQQGNSQGQSGGNPCPDPGRMGGVKDPGTGSQADKSQAEAEANVNVAQAEQMAKRRGDLPAGMDRLIDGLLHPKVDWREVLREFVTRRVKEEFRWTPSNRRFIHEELYLPSRSGESMGEIVLSMDMSGSIGPEEAKRFASELQSIIETFPVKVAILWHDSKVAHVQEWEPSDGDLVLEPKGGGGTSHVPCFDHIAMMPDEPTCYIAMTDLETCFPQQAPSYPVLWCVYHGSDEPYAPFGQVLKIDD